jgi:hypothetical protein
MRITTPFTAIVWLALSLVALAQAGATRPAPASGRYVAIGCVTKQGAGAAARYVVTDPRGEKPTTYRLQGDRELLERHVGHRVEVAGPIASGAPLTLIVRSLVWIASSCRT